MSDTARDEILNVVEKITDGGRRTFTIEQVLRELRARGSLFGVNDPYAFHVASLRKLAQSPRGHLPRF